MNNFFAQFIGAAVVALIGFWFVLQQLQWMQLLGIVLMTVAIGMGVMGDIMAAAARED